MPDIMQTLERIIMEGTRVRYLGRRGWIAGWMSNIQGDLIDVTASPPWLE